MRKPGYVTGCSCRGCPRTERLPKPGTWRCEDCAQGRHQHEAVTKPAAPPPVIWLGMRVVECEALAGMDALIVPSGWRFDP